MPRAAVIFAAALALANADQTRAGERPVRDPSPITPESVTALCYHDGLAYSEGAMLRVALPDVTSEAAEGGAIRREGVLHCRRVDGALRWSLIWKPAR
ncbi:MAG: hypothetical protein ACQEUZ_13855 [Pseudomonadota bacterium]